MRLDTVEYKEEYTYHDTNRPYIYFGIPRHPQDDLRGSIEIGHYVTLELLVWESNIGSAKIRDDRGTTGDRHGLRPVNDALARLQPTLEILVVFLFHGPKHSMVISS
jgi:hypothetical protein